MLTGEIPREARSKVVMRYVNQYLHDSSVSQEMFADSVVELYLERVPKVECRLITFMYEGDLFKRLSSNGKKIMRYLSGSVNMPTDLEECFVYALPDEYRRDCVRELVGRYGMLPTAIPEYGGNEDSSNLQRILKETGDVIEALSPIFANGGIDDDDEPHAEKALIQIDEALAELMMMRGRIESIRKVPNFAAPRLAI